MANDLATLDPADGPPSLALLALSRRPWTIEAGRAVVASEGEESIASALAYIGKAFDPVPTDPEQRAAWGVALDERLRRLAVKIAPGMPPEQTCEWRTVMVEALSDLPAMVVLTAAKRALHRPMNFLNEVEGVVREFADDVIAERRLAQQRLNNLRLSPVARPALPPQAEGAPLSFDEIRKMSPTIRSLGVSTGAITQQQVDEVEAAERSETA